MQITLPYPPSANRIWRAVDGRVILSAEAEVEGQKVDDLLRSLLNSVEVPRL